MKIKELRKEIIRHDRLYWELNQPTIADMDYDKLVRELDLKDPDNSITHAMYSSYDDDVNHNTPMLSLAKVYTLTSLLDWVNKYARSNEELYLIQPKYDGMAARYDPPNLLVTRGNGLVGKNISSKLPIIDIQTNHTLTKIILGEIIIPDAQFNKIQQCKKLNITDYKNPRNTVAGLIRQKYNHIFDILNIRLQFIDYDSISYHVTKKEFEKDFFKIVDQLKQYNYPMDGIVIKLEDKNYCDELGNTRHHPNGHMAFKFTNEQATSILLDVTWSIGNKNITPVGIIEPVNISGSTINKVTLHNMNMILKKHIHIGDKLIIEKAGDVIPEVVKAIGMPNHTTINITHCPGCNTPISIDKGIVSCVNSNCDATNAQKLITISKKLKINNLGDKTIYQLVKLYKVKDMFDIYHITKDQLLQLDGFSEQSASNLLASINKSKSMTPANAFMALSIYNIGTSIFEKILAVYSIEELLDISIDKLCKVPGVGEVRAITIVEYIQTNKHRIQLWLNKVIFVQEDYTQTVCFTGKFKPNKQYYIDLASAKGCKVIDRVSNKLDLLIKGDIEKSSKLELAMKLNIPILDVLEWIQTIK